MKTLYLFVRRIALKIPSIIEMAYKNIWFWLFLSICNLYFYYFSQRWLMSLLCGVASVLVVLIMLILKLEDKYVNKP